MNLVPENINEAIKHLKPRSEEEISSNLKNLSNAKIWLNWTRANSYYETKMYYKELRKRAFNNDDNAWYYMEFIQKHSWYSYNQEDLEQK